jgi:hypothetical protein
MSVVMLHSSRAARVIIVTACNSNNGQYAINFGNIHGMAVQFKTGIFVHIGHKHHSTTPKTNKRNACTMFKSKQALVCMAIPISRRFDRSRGLVIFLFEPAFLAVIFCMERIELFLAVLFCMERILHHEPNEKTKIKVPLHKKSRQKMAR